MTPMNEENTRAQAAQEQPEAQAPAAAEAAPAAEQTAETAESKPEKTDKADKTDKEKKDWFGKKNRELESLKAKLETAENKAAELKDQLLRTAAEYDNYRKRTEREKAALYTDAMADTILEFLPVADNLERALAVENSSAEDLRKGVEMVNQQMLDALSKLGVAVIGLEGEPFDPQLHNAVAHVENQDRGENVIDQVFQRGYRIGDKIVRHAMVQVAN